MIEDFEKYSEGLLYGKQFIKWFSISYKDADILYHLCWSYLFHPTRAQYYIHTEKHFLKFFETNAPSVQLYKFKHL